MDTTKTHSDPVLLQEVIDLWLRLKFGVTLEDIKRESEQLLAMQKTTPPDVQVFQIVVDHVCMDLGVTERDILGKSRVQRLVYARHLAMLLCRKLTGAPLSKIGRHFGQRDHSTVHHGVRQAQNKIDVHCEDGQIYDSLKARISDRINLPIADGRYQVTQKQVI